MAHKQPATLKTQIHERERILSLAKVQQKIVHLVVQAIMPHNSRVIGRGSSPGLPRSFYSFNLLNQKARTTSQMIVGLVSSVLHILQALKSLICRLVIPPSLSFYTWAFQPGR